jgi:hypothetical protein
MLAHSEAAGNTLPAARGAIHSSALSSPARPLLLEGRRLSFVGRTEVTRSLSVMSRRGRAIEPEWLRRPPITIGETIPVDPGHARIGA